MAKKQNDVRKGTAAPPKRAKVAADKANTVVKKKKRRISRFHLVVILFVSILILSGAIGFMLLSTPQYGADGTEKPAVFAVKSVEVVGDTHYSPEAIIGISGIRVGQSIFSVNKKEASQKIWQAFPYINYIDIGNSSFDTITITVKEIDTIGVRYAGGNWVVVGSNGRAVELLPVESDLPPRYLYFKGVTPAECELGGDAMDERSLQIVNGILEAFRIVRENASSRDTILDFTPGVATIDLTDKTDIQLHWNHQITIAIGNEKDLQHKLDVVSTTLPLIFETHGLHTTGVLNLRSYSDDDPNNNQAIYTPDDILDNGN